MATNRGPSRTRACFAKNTNPNFPFPISINISDYESAIYSAMYLLLQPNPTVLMNDFSDMGVSFSIGVAIHLSFSKFGEYDSLKKQQKKKQQQKYRL